MSTAELERPSRRRTDCGAVTHRERSRRESPPRGSALGALALLPAVRPCDGVSPAYARRRVAEFDACSSATAWLLGEGLRRLDAAERRCIVDCWRICPEPGRSSLITDGGCDVRVGGTGVTGAARTALLERLPLSRPELAVYEGGLFGDAPASAIALLVRPPTVWPLEEALIADRLVPRGPRFEPERFEALERHARGRVRLRHLALLRDVVAKLNAQLPVEGLPTASGTVAAGCAVIASDDGWCAAIAARQLARYAMSARVGGEVQAHETSSSAPDE